MAGTTNYAFEAHKSKVAELARAAEDLAHTRADAIGADPDVYLLDMVERMAGRLGQDQQLKMWHAIRHTAKQMTDINYGHPSDLVQSAIIGRLFTRLMLSDHLRENPEKVFAGLSAVQ